MCQIKMQFATYAIIKDKVETIVVLKCVFKFYDKRVAHAFENPPLGYRVLNLTKVSDFALLQYFHSIIFVRVLVKDEQDFTVAANSEVLEQREVLKACLMCSCLNFINDIFITLLKLCCFLFLLIKCMQ